MITWLLLVAFVFGLATGHVFLGILCAGMALAVPLLEYLERRYVERKTRPVFPLLSMSDLGIGPISKVLPSGERLWKCDGCGKLSADCTISPGDGYTECVECRT